MKHYFDAYIAEKYGINCAIILQHLLFWIEKNRADERNMYDGMYWTRMSKKGIKKYFTYLSDKQVSYAIKKLIKEGLIVKSQDDGSFDRSNRYAITERGYDALRGMDKTDHIDDDKTAPVQEDKSASMDNDKTALLHKDKSVSMDNDKTYLMHDDKRDQSLVQKGSIIGTKGSNDNIYINNIYNTTDIKTDIKTDIRQDIKSYNKKPAERRLARTVDDVIAEVEDEVLRETLAEFVDMRRKNKRPCTAKAIELIIKKLYNIASDNAERVRVVEQSVMNGWQGVFPLSDARNDTTKKNSAPMTNNPFILAAQEGNLK